MKVSALTQETVTVFKTFDSSSAEKKMKQIPVNEQLDASLLR